MVITYGKLKKKNNEFTIKGFGKNTTEVLMTIYAMAYRLKYDNNNFESVKDVFEKCLELEHNIERTEMF